MSSIYDSAVGLINRTADRNAKPFDTATSVAPPHGRWGIVHYGVMVPDLPAPLRFFDAIVVLGTAKVPIFDNRELVRTTPSDSAWVLIGSGATRDSFRPYSIEDECALAADGSALRFGDELAIDRTPESVAVRADVPGATVELALTPTPAVSHFVHLPGLYDHWSVLCEYEGTFSANGETVTRTGLCTYEYARAVNVPLPFVFFTYQILNVDDRTQILLVEVLGPAGLPVQRTVYLRSVDGTATVYTRGFRHTVHEQGDVLTTPHGRRMQMPKRMSWSVQDSGGSELVSIDATTNDDFAFGLAAGYAGSYAYTGRFRGESISGTGYIEWIDRR